MKLIRKSSVYCELTAEKTITRAGVPVYGNRILEGDVIEVADEVGSVLLADEAASWSLPDLIPTKPTKPTGVEPTK